MMVKATKYIYILTVMDSIEERGGVNIDSGSIISPTNTSPLHHPSVNKHKARWRRVLKKDT